MKHILVLGLMATTVLTAVPAAAQREGGRSRGEGGWVNSPRPNQSAGDRGGRGGGNWSRPAASEQRSSPTVTNVPVPRSESGRGNWNRGEATARPDRPDRGNWNRGEATDRPDRADRGNWQGGRRGWDGNGNRGTTVSPPVAQPAPPTQPAQRSWRGNDDRADRNWNRNDNDRRTSPGTDNRPRADWNRNNDRDTWNRDRNNWNNNRGTWNNRNDQPQNRSYSYGRRLNDRDRWSDTRRWDNGWRNNNRYDWQRYRTVNRSIYRMPTYYAPYGWNSGYRRFSIGIYLSNILFAQDYWLDDPYEYRLPPAYGPLRWVRYYDDAMLVDIRDGYVVDVIHGFFW